MEFVVSATPRPLYPQERPGTHWYSSTLSLPSVLDGVGGQRHAPAALPQERPGTHWYSSTLSLPSVLHGVGGQRHTPAALLPGKTRYPLV